MTECYFKEVNTECYYDIRNNVCRFSGEPCVYSQIEYDYSHFVNPNNDE